MASTAKIENNGFEHQDQKIMALNVKLKIIIMVVNIKLKIMVLNAKPKTMALNLVISK